MKVLVVGGAGYIGAHAARALADAGHEPTLFDSLVSGHPEVAQRLDVPLVIGDLMCAEDVDRAVCEHTVGAVMHFAAFCYVGESVEDPGKYYRNNVTGTLNLLEAMRRRSVRSLVFSSTCAIYGNPQRATLDEDHPQEPVNPYGQSKLMVEKILRDYDRAYGLRYVSLRYFNAAGSSSDGRLGEDHEPETHLIPLCLLAGAGRRDWLTIFGTDYDTPDGTCIRDYVHVDDLATAHVLALEHLRAGGSSLALNVGTGKGHSVRDVIRCAEQVTGRPIPVRDGPRRAGDPPILVATADRIQRTLGWRPAYGDLESIVLTACNWFRAGGKYA